MDAQIDDVSTSDAEESSARVFELARLYSLRSKTAKGIAAVATSESDRSQARSGAGDALEMSAPKKRSSVVSQLVNRFESREREVRQISQLERRQLRKMSDTGLPSSSLADGNVKGHPNVLRMHSDSSVSSSSSRKSSADVSFRYLRSPTPVGDAMPTVTELGQEKRPDVVEKVEKVEKERQPSPGASLYEDVTMTKDDDATKVTTDCIYEDLTDTTSKAEETVVNGNMTSLDSKTMKNRPLPSLPPDGGGTEYEALPAAAAEKTTSGEPRKSIFSRIKRRMAVKSTKGSEKRNSKGSAGGGGGEKQTKKHSYVEVDLPCGNSDDDNDALELKSEDETPEPEDVYDDVVVNPTQGGEEVTIKVEDVEDVDSPDVYEDVDDVEEKGKRLRSPSPPSSPKPEMTKRTSSASFNLSSVEGKLAPEDVGRERSSTYPGSETSSIDESVYETPADLLHEELVVIGFADALWDYVSSESDELSFSAGDTIAVTEMTDEEWWGGFIEDRQGWFPKNYVRMRVTDSGATHEASSLSKRFSIRRKKLSPVEMRGKVLEEILGTERDYVSHLSDIVQGYLVRCRQNDTLFPLDLLQLVFCNVEDLCQMHTGLLASLEESVSPENMYDSCIGHCFVEIEEKFQAYSEYCNNHPDAVAKLAELQSIQNYKFFFEACRLLQNMQEISLDGYLLTPVQKICKYPLQLSELLKTTPESHPDHEKIVAAKSAMSNVAVMINERKRRYEGLHRIAKWQVTIEGWEGEDVIVRSSDLIHSGELNKISKGRSQERKLFLFDNQLIYCKKELLGGLQYRGRLDMRNCEVINLKDGEGELCVSLLWCLATSFSGLHGSTPVNNAWKMNNVKKNKWYVLYTRTPEEKSKWIKAFAEEKARIEEDEETGFSVTKTKRQAIMSQARKIKGTMKGLKQKPLSKAAILQPTTIMHSQGTVKLPKPVSSADFGMGKAKKKQRNKLPKRKDLTT
ncbi:spermatogenesis-associated protein 13-like isoform X3 [Oscarella lobularis]|uniref:spermatogenesis-associated protein 13-like isoform X3 n=1 Tax=Oscarella lobularis TaxID=121494 RepID=UPI0033136D6E